ncbi:SWIM zinc finger family protein [Sphaerisporangium aureirubrum]|uniref:SWIM zinc finger family protein n=1 Tax=Sphaerisporangium aureirubrum TaxID=1544736 RepID=A0ABW1NW07_9ACTN
MPDVIWGECKGSGATPYRACVDLADTAYRCSCPSRKFPCKHALGLLLLWSSDGVPQTDELPPWVAEWVNQRRTKAARAAAPPRPSPGEPPEQSAGTGPAAGEAAEPGTTPVVDGATGGADAAGRRAAQREERVAAGLAELERWLGDQIGQGLASARRDAPAQWQELARRLVDAQAPGVAGFVSRLPRVLADEDWPSRLLGEYGLLNLLAVGHRRAADLPPPLRDTIRSRVGYPVSREDVLAGERVRDEWDVLGQRDDEQDHLVSRRVWLRGRQTGRFALILSFAPPGQALDASLVTGTAVDADLAFYPGASPLRAVIAVRHAPALPAPPQGTTVTGALTEIATALTGDPWTDSWPVILKATTPARSADLWLLTDPATEDQPATAVEGMPEPAIHTNAGGQEQPAPDAGGTPGPLPHTGPPARDTSEGTPESVTQVGTAVPDGVKSGGEGMPEAVTHADAAVPDRVVFGGEGMPEAVTHAGTAAQDGVVSDGEGTPEAVTHAGMDVPDGGVSGGGGMPGMVIHPVVGHPWRLLAVSGGRAVTVAGEWTPRGVRPLTVWDEEGRVVVL